MKIKWYKPHRVVCDCCGESAPFEKLSEAKAFIKFHQKECYDGDDGVRAQDAWWRVDAALDVEG